MSTEVANPLRPEVPSVPVPDPHFLERVGSIPIVTTTIDQLAQIYQYSKNTSPYMKYTLEKAEAGVKTVTQSALPIVNKLEKPSEFYCLFNSPCDEFLFVRGPNVNRSLLTSVVVS